MSALILAEHETSYNFQLKLVTIYWPYKDSRLGEPWTCKSLQVAGFEASTSRLNVQQAITTTLSSEPSTLAVDNINNGRIVAKTSDNTCCSAAPWPTEIARRTWGHVFLCANYAWIIFTLLLIANNPHLFNSWIAKEQAWPIELQISEITK